MGLTDQAISDFAQISSDAAGWGVSITLTAPGGQTATLNGFHARTNMGVDSEGNQVQSVHAHVTISERVITGANGHYPIRNGSGEINFKNHKVDVADSSGMRHYLVLDWFADEKLGGIVIRLQDFAG